MGNQAFVFEHPKFGKIRGIILNGDTKFVGKDVTEALGYSNSRKALQDHVPAKFKCVINAKTLKQMASESKGNETELFEFDSPRGLTFINEAGLYKLILRSNLPAAEEFSDWVCEEVLPAIRRTGTYSLNAKTEPEPAINSAPDFASLQAQIDELEAMVAQLLKGNKYSPDNRLEKNIAAAVKSGKNINRVIGHLRPAYDYIALMLNEDETFAVVKVGQSKDVEPRLNKIAKKYYLHIVSHYKTALFSRKVALAVER